jgi:hypothetical protein
LSLGLLSYAGIGDIPSLQAFFGPASLSLFKARPDGDAELPTNPPWKGLFSPARLATPLENPPPSHLRADDRLLRSPLSGDSLATTKVARAVSS